MRPILIGRIFEYREMPNFEIIYSIIPCLTIPLRNGDCHFTVKHIPPKLRPQTLHRHTEFFSSRSNGYFFLRDGSSIYHPCPPFGKLASPLVPAELGSLALLFMIYYLLFHFSHPKGWLPPSAPSDHKYKFLGSFFKFRGGVPDGAGACV